MWISNQNYRKNRGVLEGRRFPPQIQPAKSNRLSNRLQPSPNTWHRNGTTAEALPLVLFRFTTSRPEIRDPRSERLDSSGGKESIFWFGCGIGEASKPMEIWRFKYNTH